MGLLITFVICLLLLCFGIIFSIVEGHTKSKLEQKFNRIITDYFKCFRETNEVVENVTAHNIVSAIGRAIVEEQNKLVRFDKVDEQLKLSEQYYRKSQVEIIILEDRRPILTVVKNNSGL